MYLSDEIQSSWPCWWQLTFVKPTTQPVTVPSKHVLPHASPHRCFFRKNIVFFPIPDRGIWTLNVLSNFPQTCRVNDWTRMWNQLSLVLKPKLIPQWLLSHRTEVISTPLISGFWLSTGFSPASLLLLLPYHPFPGGLWVVSRVACHLGWLSKYSCSWFIVHKINNGQHGCNRKLRAWQTLF